MKPGAPRRWKKSGPPCSKKRRDFNRAAFCPTAARRKKTNFPNCHWSIGMTIRTGIVWRENRRHANPDFISRRAYCWTGDEGFDASRFPLTPALSMKPEEHPTSNIQRRTSNGSANPRPFLRCEFDVGRSMFSLGSGVSTREFSFPGNLSVCSVVVRILALGFCLSVAVPAFTETVLLTGATVHTVSGPTLAPGQVLIKDGKIAAVEKVVKTQADRITKFDGQHSYPGLIAASTSLGLVEINSVRATRDASEVGEYTPDVESWVAVNPDSELIPVARANGITHFLPVPSGGIVAGQSGLMVADGWTIEDMTVKKPVALHVFWPGMELNTTPREEFKDKSKWKSLADQAKERREKIRALEDFFAEARDYARAREAGGKHGLPAKNV